MTIPFLRDDPAEVGAVLEIVIDGFELRVAEFYAL